MTQQIYSRSQDNQHNIADSKLGVTGRVIGRILRTVVQRLDLVSREEFEVQRQVLRRSREKIVRLEQEILEKGSRG